MPMVPPSTCPVCARPPPGFSPASRVLPLGMAKMQDLGKAGPGGAARGSALSFPHRRIPPGSPAPCPWLPVLLGLHCLGGLGPCAHPHAPSPESQTRMEKASTHRQPTLGALGHFILFKNLSILHFWQDCPDNASLKTTLIFI